MSEANMQENRGSVGKGRPKGSLNKTTAVAKYVIAHAADRLGGVDRLVAWAEEDKKNEQIFWASIYPRLLPLQVNADIEAHVGITRIERIIVSDKAPGATEYRRNDTY